MVKNVKELEVFNSAYDLVLKIYKITENFHQDERFGFVSDETISIFRTDEPHRRKQSIKHQGIQEICRHC